MQANNSVSDVENVPFSAAFKEIKHVPYTFSAPTMVVQFTSLTREQEASIAGMGLSKDASKPNRFMGIPDSEYLKPLYALGPTNSGFQGGTVDIDAFFTYTYALKGMGIYSEMSQSADLLCDENILVKGIKLAGTQTRFWNLSVPIKTFNMNYTEKNADITEADKKFYGVTSVQRIYSTINGTRSLTGKVIKPSIEETIILSDHEGNFFPYFEGMNLPDSSAFEHVFGKLFFPLLGENDLNAAAVWKKLRTGFRQLKTTQAGIALSHAYTGIELSMTAQAKITFIVDNGLYKGFVLQGQYGGVLANTSIKCYGSEKMIADIRSLNKHAQILEKILQILRSPTKVIKVPVERTESIEDEEMTEDKTVPVYDLDLTSINTSRKLVNVLTDYNMDLISTQTEPLFKYISELTFGDTYAAVNSTSILASLAYMQTGNMNELQAYPAYLGGIFASNFGRFHVAVGIFGAYAPSLNYGRTDGDKVFTIPSHEAEDPNLAKDAEGKRILPYLPFKSEPSGLAVNQWLNLSNTGKFKVSGPRKGKAEFVNQKPVAFQLSGVQFDVAYDMLKDIVAMNKASRKRKADGDGSEISKRLQKKMKVTENTGLADLI